MLLHEKLKEEYSTKESKLVLILQMGYSNPKKGLVTLKEFIEEGSIEAWLKKGRYDFKYGNEDFIKALAAALDVDIDIVLLKAHKRIGKVCEYANTSLEPIVHFERKGENLFMLMAYDKYRKVSYDIKELIHKSDAEVLEKMQIHAKTHYQKYKGTLPLWGKIEGYQYRHIDGIVYDIDMDLKVLDKERYFSTDVEK